MKHLYTIIAALLIFGFGFSASAQISPQFYQYPHNHLDWYTLESEHFLVHFQEGNSRPAQVASRIAEEIYEPVTQMYGHEPDQKVSIVLIDREDYSNGAAYFFDNKIEIWLPSLDTPLRGTHNWMRNVITHEFVHIIQLQVSMKGSRRHPASYFQWLSYDDVRRPDVLYGFPSGFISYPLANISMPAWMAEGTAQFMMDDLNYDYWDSHRDMLLRVNIMDSTYHSLEKMGTFYSKTSLERELVYNMGFNFTQYLSDNYSEQSVVDLSRAFSQRRMYNVRNALKEVTGKDGRQVYQDWINELKNHYQQQLADVSGGNFEYVEEDGFFNFFPTFSPDGSRIAYLSNRGREDTRLSLIIKDDREKEIAITYPATYLHEIAGHQHYGSCHDERLDIRQIATSFSFSPDGKQLAFSKIEKNKFGEEYRDIHIYDFGKGEVTRRLTQNKRLQEPAWSPDGKYIAATQIFDGSLNVVLYDLEQDTLKTITHFRNGEQTFRPVWHPDGETIFLAYSDQSMRGIYSLTIETGEFQPLFTDLRVDYRDPFVSPDGQHLYFSSDYTGIFNIYRVSLDDMESGMIRITDVMGGAFTPVVNQDGDILYAGFTSGGYKIKKHIPGQAEIITIEDEPKVSNQRIAAAERQPLNLFDDTDLVALPSIAKAVADTGRYHFPVETRGASDRELYKYEDVFTSFSFYPVIRFDNYSQHNGLNRILLRNGNFGDLGDNLWRDSKFGIYGSSRNVLERFTFFGGFMVGPGSREFDGLDDFLRPGRLVALDRDAFLTVEYAGLPFIERSWSPTISLSLFNIRRNVRDGLQIEEFPCTACLPDTTNTDISYNILQFEASLISKLNRFTVLQVGYYHSPYRVSTEPFFSREFQETIAGSTSRYFIGNTYTAAVIFEMMEYHRFSDAAPIGLKGHFRYSFEPSRLLDGYDIRDGQLVPVYNNFRNHSLELDFRYGFRLWDQFFSVYTRGFSYLNPLDEFFFLDYFGGFIGMRSYPFFALGGNTTAFTQLNFYTPLMTEVYKQVGRVTIDNIFLRLFAEAGNGWFGPLNIGNDIKKGVGAELRVSLNSYYFFPTRLFVSGAYGFDEFNLSFPDQFITPEGAQNVTYGREFLINFGVLFNFDF